MKTIKIGILGLGTVGTGVARMLEKEKDLISSKLDAELVIARIADLDIDTDRGLTISRDRLTTDAFAVIDDPEIDIIVELIGGETFAKECFERAIAKGKHIVTANKALIASHGNDLFRRAAEQGVDIAFEASVAGCIPIIKTMRETLAGNTIHSLAGIMNGTCNYILTKITCEGSSFEDALAQAQESGFAEADPTLDIEGYDTAHKLAILNSLAYGMKVNLDDIYVEGITRVTAEDIRFADEFGYRIKLLAIGKRTNGAVEARVHPTMIPTDNLFSSVNHAVNAVNVCGSATGDMFLVGQGAGMLPTASAVVSDLVDIARNLITGAGQRVPYLAFTSERMNDLPILPMDEVTCRYYVRFMAMDKPGVLSRISGILGEYNISVRSVHQKEGAKGESSVPLVMLTSVAREKDMRQALADIESLDIIQGKAALIRIEE
ncbi:homoserine dehydrogenase [Desulfoluna spongiiphila]|uniref:Homoserine dehydrogenase n=1 Tax=Desulfoluna spongiiphila TaxID=419481 RepID=A0A1G5II78_9BACT|nr:homoserine dehydrogenase [Desulfoluna spongiiphila]SCY75782.1 homoserine dehydrogenase [Desulfoluna spongiiphila]VVS90907.1 homoserine dehydrogenase [Desulfoluna spongiiphila]